MTLPGDDRSESAAAEAARIMALGEYHLLDTPEEEAFDAIVRLATRLCDAPIGMITLIASDRQWFKARIGVDVSETPLDHSICRHALPIRDRLVIPDLTLDDRTRDNPFVTGAMAMRFYGGIPLRSPSGHALGTLCVIDGAPRRQGLTLSQGEILQALGAQVMTLFEARRALLAEEAVAARLRKSAAFLEGILAASPDCIKALDLSGNLTFMNDTGLRAMGVDSFEAVEGMPWSRFWEGSEAGMAWEAVMSARSGCVGRFEGWSTTHAGMRTFWDVSVTPIAGPDTRPERLLVVARDQTEIRKAAIYQAALATLGKRLRNATDPAEVAARVAETAGQTLELSRAAFGMVDVSADTIAFERDWTRAGQRSLVGHHPYGRYSAYIEALARSAGVSIENTEEDPRTAAYRGILGEYDVKALLDIPVMKRGGLVGVLCLHDTAPRAWTERERVFAKTLAEQASTALGRIAAEEQRQLRTREVGHRLKNLLAMVQALATQTMRSASDIQSASDVLAGRLVALGQAQDLLLDGEMSSSPIHDVVRSALQLHADAADRLVVSGPPVQIGGKVALSLSLMLHELGTNAVKYGAFSAPDGHVEVGWRIIEDGAAPRMRLTWVEHGGPLVVPPTRRGFGSRLIERGLAGQVGGRVELTFPPSGLRFMIEASLAAFETEN